MTSQEIVAKAIELGHTYTTFAKVTGVDAVTTFRLFKGRFEPSMKNYRKYLEYFETVKKQIHVD